MVNLKPRLDKTPETRERFQGLNKQQIKNKIKRKMKKGLVTKINNLSKFIAESNIILIIPFVLLFLLFVLLTQFYFHIKIKMIADANKENTNNQTIINSLPGNKYDPKQINKHSNNNNEVILKLLMLIFKIQFGLIIKIILFHKFCFY